MSVREAYHDGESVSTHGLVVEGLGGVERPRARVEAELSQAEGVGAAQQGEGQLVLLVLIGGVQTQNLGVGCRVLRHARLVTRLGEPRPVVVSVDHSDEHLSGPTDQIL